jgi:hypothetical protein
MQKLMRAFSMIASARRIVVGIWLVGMFTTAQDGPQTVESIDQYSSLRECGQYCFWVPKAGGEWVDGVGVSALGCKMQGFNKGVLDSCFCRTDVQYLGQTYLSTCVSSNCKTVGGNTNDISGAVSLYEEYCEKKGYTAAPASVSASTTRDSTTQVTPPETVTAAVTTSSTADRPYSPASKLTALFVCVQVSLLCHPYSAHLTQHR